MVMPMQQQQQQEWGIRESSNLLYALVNAHATAITPFLRQSFGREALGWPGLFAFVLILAVAGFTGSSGMLIYLGLWLFALACQRLHTFSLIRKGVVLHSKFEGRPEFAVRLAFGNVQAAVLLVEPLVCAGVGGTFIDVGEPVVGWFLVYGAAALLVREVVHRMIDQKRVQAMHDARIEQEYIARQYRNQG
jgi:hypothetical protein